VWSPEVSTGSLAGGREGRNQVGTLVGWWFMESAVAIASLARSTARSNNTMATRSNSAFTPSSVPRTSTRPAPHAQENNPRNSHSLATTPWFTITGTHMFITSGTSTVMIQHHLHHVDGSTPNGTALSLITRSFNGNTVRNFPTHGQLSAAQGNLTSCLNFDFAILNLFEPSAP
jgi:hypothetical protein